MKQLTLNDIVPEDYRFINKDTSGFNPAHNQAVITEVINSGMRMHKVMKDSYKKDTENSIDILSSYSRHSLDGGEKTLEKYMGKEWMARIYGEQLVEKLRIADSVRRLNLAAGNTKFSNFYLT